MNQNKSLALVLAAGRGTRMKSEVPKPLSLVYNKPIISWIIESFKKNNIDICLIINPILKKKLKTTMMMLDLFIKIILRVLVMQ